MSNAKDVLHSLSGYIMFVWVYIALIEKNPVGTCISGQSHIGGSP